MNFPIVDTWRPGDMIRCAVDFLLRHLMVPVVFLALWFYAFPGAELPDIVQEHEHGLSPEITKICIAYEGMFDLDAKHRVKPKDLYTMVGIPHGTTNGRRILNALEQKTEEPFRKVKNGQGPGNTKHRIAAWNKLGLVLLDESAREAYDLSFPKGSNIKEELNNLCGERWRRMEADKPNLASSKRRFAFGRYWTIEVNL